MRFYRFFLLSMGKPPLFLIYYKMKTTFIFENFLSRALVLQSKKALTRYIYG